MNDKYCYAKTNVLINKYNIKDKELLEELESESTNTKLLSLELRPDQIRNNLSIEHFKDIHRFLFGNLYDWAGEFREINIVKAERVLSGASVEYSDFNNIASELNQFMLKVADFDWSNTENSILSTFEFLLGVWEIHPFREGNTRTCITFMKRFLSSKGIDFNAKLLKEHSSYVRDSLVMATYDKPEYLMGILTDSFIQKTDGGLFLKSSTATEYKIAKEKYYSTKEANELRIAKRIKK